MGTQSVLIDLIGRVFGRLTVVRRHGTGAKPSRWECVCECGSFRIVAGDKLREGRTKSCGCYSRDRARAAKRTHGGTGTPEYVVWCKMKERCDNPRATRYDLYGGRGIKVCERWASSFPNFLADMGPRPSRHHSIDRIDVNGGYYPENCRWATRVEQARNTRSNRLIEFRGETKTLTEWAELIGLGVSTLSLRLSAGWSIEDALTRRLGPSSARRTHTATGKRASMMGAR